MEIKLRDPKNLMKLSKLGSFHQSKLSFLRSFLNEFKDWDYNRDLFQLNEKGYGIAVYSFSKNKRVYSLVCFANQINDEERIEGIIEGPISARERRVGAENGGPNPSGSVASSTARAR